MHLVTPTAGIASARAPIERAATIPSHSRQLVLIGQFGALAFPENDMAVVLRTACWTAAEGTGAGFARILHFRPDEHALVEQARVDWRGEAAGGPQKISANPRTTAGFAWHSGQPAVSDHLMSGGRFRVPDALVERGIRRTLTVPVRGDEAERGGVLEVGCEELGEFSQHDVSFLQSIACCVAAAAGRQANRAARVELAASAAAREALLRELRHKVRSDLQRISAFAEQEAWRSADPDHRASLYRIVHQVVALAGVDDHQPEAPSPGQR